MTGGECLLGLNGASAHNQNSDCALHGKFDVWLTEKNQLLITDMGFPSEEPKQCLALGVNEDIARKLARNKATELRTSILTTESKCLKCGRQYWVNEHKLHSGLLETGKNRLCPDCIGEIKGLEEKLGVLGYWCG